MTALAGKDLVARLEGNVDRSKRLVVTPLLHESQLSESEASIDLRLGSVFVAFRRGRMSTIDWSDAKPEMPTDRVYVPLGEYFVIHPNQFVLAQTLEYVRVPSDLMCYVVTRSRWGRTGLIVATAVGVQPNYAGVITLELRNLGEVPLKLFPGSPVLQLFFHSLSSETAFSLRTNSVSTETMPPKVDFDARLLRCKLGKAALLL